MTFQLRPDVTFLNHGSFGACPLEIFEPFQELQRELEQEPVDFMMRKLGPRMQRSREALERFMDAPDALSIVLLPNVTSSLNAVWHGLHFSRFFSPGDEVLTSSHEYGGCVRMLNVYAPPAKIVSVSFSLPIHSPQQIIDELWETVTEKTKVIFISHITSPTGMILPVKEICQRAREKGILTIIDGAHAPGQINVSLATIDADFYGANCHKWMCAPKSVGFLYARKSVQYLVSSPPIVSWGVSPESNFMMGLSGSIFVDAYAWPGTIDPCAAISLVSVIEFLQHSQHGEKLVESRKLAQFTRRAFSEALGITEKEHIYADSDLLYSHLVILPIGDFCAKKMHAQLWEHFKLECPGIVFEGRNYLRVAINVYNSKSDIEKLIKATKSIMNE